MKIIPVRYLQFSSQTFAVLVLAMASTLLFAVSEAKARFVEIQTITSFKDVYLINDPEVSDVTVHTIIRAGSAEAGLGQTSALLTAELAVLTANSQNDSDITGKLGEWTGRTLSHFSISGKKDKIPELLKFSAGLLGLPAISNDTIAAAQKNLTNRFSASDLTASARQFGQSVNRLVLSRHPMSSPDKWRSTKGDDTGFQALKQFHARYYVPANAVLIFYGNITPDEVKFWIEEVLSGFEQGEKNPRQWRSIEIAKPHQQTVTVPAQTGFLPAFEQHLVAPWASSGDKNRDRLIFRIAQIALRQAVKSHLPDFKLGNLQLENRLNASFETVTDQELYARHWVRTIETDTSTAFQKKFGSSLRQLAAEGISSAQFQAILSQLEHEISQLKGLQFSVLLDVFEALTVDAKPLQLERQLELLRSINITEVNDLLEALANAHRKVTVLRAEVTK